MSFLTDDIQAYRAGSFSLEVLAQKLAQAQPVTSSASPVEGTWKEVLAARDSGLLSNTDLAAVQQVFLAHHIPSPASSPFYWIKKGFKLLGLFLLPLVVFPFVLFGVLFPIVNALQLNVLWDFILISLLLPALYVLEWQLLRIKHSRRKTKAS